MILCPPQTVKDNVCLSQPLQPTGLETQDAQTHTRTHPGSLRNRVSAGAKVKAVNYA